MILPSYQSTDAHIVIVGSNSGIGQATISQLLSIGCTIHGIDIGESCNLPSNERLQYHQCNPMNLNALEKVAININRNSPSLTGLVCLSGTIKHFNSIIEQSAEEWQEVFDISFKSCYNACKTFAPYLLQSPKAAIVNMSSGLAFGGQKNYGPYTNAKAAVNSLSKTLATELAPTIRVNTVAPGAVDTPFIVGEDGTTRFDKERYLSIVPLGTIGQPAEMADLIVFLLSEGASHITGQCIHINGGAMMM